MYGMYFRSIEVLLNSIKDNATFFADEEVVYVYLLPTGRNFEI